MKNRPKSVTTRWQKHVEKCSSDNCTMRRTISIKERMIEEFVSECEKVSLIESPKDIPNQNYKPKKKTKKSRIQL